MTIIHIRIGAMSYIKHFAIALTIFCCSGLLYAQNVYVCSSGSSTKYHLSKDCRGLKRCSGSIQTISLSAAKNKGRTACKICAENANTNSTSTKNNGSKQVQANIGNLHNMELAKTAKGRKTQLIQHSGYITCYNAQWLIPNWVAYDLTKKEVHGTESRPNKGFEPDPLAEGKSAEHRDYSNSGFSRGHMAPAADMKWSEQAMMESFYLSNVCPQVAELNGGVWKRLEDRCRALAEDGTVYICCGPIVESKHKKIGNNGVAVPAKFFKVLCMQRKGKWQAIGFVMPNTKCKGSMFDYAQSVDEVEEMTGHDFFYNLPDNVEQSIESGWKMKDWQ